MKLHFFNVNYLAPRIQQPVTKLQIKDVHKFYNQLDNFCQKIERKKYSSFIKLVQICQKSHKNSDSQFWSLLLDPVNKTNVKRWHIRKRLFLISERDGICTLIIKISYWFVQ